MSVFENIEDMDINFITKDLPVDYEYDGYFSPMKIIDLLEKERW